MVLVSFYYTSSFLTLLNQYRLFYQDFLSRDLCRHHVTRQDNNIVPGALPKAATLDLGAKILVLLLLPNVVVLLNKTTLFLCVHTGIPNASLHIYPCYLPQIVHTWRSNVCDNDLHILGMLAANQRRTSQNGICNRI